MILEPLTWLWSGYIPKGKFSIVEGDPGLGKSTMVADLAARLSAGREMPDGEPTTPAVVAMLSAEETESDLRQRLTAARADMDMVRLMGVDNTMTLPDDCAILQRTITELGISVLILDPLSGYLSARTDSHKEHDVRQALRPLCAIASSTGAAVIGVRHLNKSTDSKLLYKGMGSIGFNAVARQVALVAEDPRDPSQRILKVHKSNYTGQPADLSFKVIGDGATGAGKVEWTGEAHLEVHEDHGSPSRPRKSLLAQQILQTELVKGPVAVAILREKAQDAGVGWRLMEAAKSVLGVESVVRRDGGRGTYCWRMR